MRPQPSGAGKKLDPAADLPVLQFRQRRRFDPRLAQIVAPHQHIQAAVHASAPGDVQGSTLAVVVSLGQMNPAHRRG
jgi:hypothetical protein